MTELKFSNCIASVTDDNGREALVRADDVVELMWIKKSSTTMVTYRYGPTTTFVDASKRVYGQIQTAVLGMEL